MFTRNLILFCLYQCAIFTHLSCTDIDSVSSFDTDDTYPDGDYCANVHYYNPNTGRESDYVLNVEVADGKLVVINWPNGGWLDDSHFSPEDITGGEASFTSDQGYEYTVELLKSGDCNYATDVDEIEEEQVAPTCPRCGDEKEEYEEYCSSCDDKLHNTCSRCGGYEYNVNGRLCDNCQDEAFNTCSRCLVYEYGVNGGICSNCRYIEREQEEHEQQQRHDEEEQEENDHSDENN